MGNIIRFAKAQRGTRLALERLIREKLAAEAVALMEAGDGEAAEALLRAYLVLALAVEAQTSPS